MGLKLIGVSCLEVGVLHPSILKTERPPRHLISAGLIPHHEHLLARSALPRERVRSVTLKRHCERLRLVEREHSPGVPQRPRPAPDAHASLLKLPPPQIIFWAATPAPGLRPLV